MDPSDVPAMRQALLAAHSALEAEGPARVQAESEVVPSANDEDEAPHREMDQSIASARNRARAERIAAIDQALARLADDPDDFGVCTACGDDIAPRRLALMPFVRLCVACQAAADGAPGARHTRKKVTDYGG
jgi:DnaK suppressor protein